MAKSKTIFIKGKSKNVEVVNATTEEDTVLPTPKQKPKKGDGGKE